MELTAGIPFTITSHLPFTASFLTSVRCCHIVRAKLPARNSQSCKVSSLRNHPIRRCPHSTPKFHFKTLKEIQLWNRKDVALDGGALLSGCWLACATAPNSNSGANSGGTCAKSLKTTKHGKLADAKPAAHAGVDFEAVAARLVNENARIKEGEIVLIDRRPARRELLEAIAVHVRKVGAYPLLFMNSEGMSKRMWTDVPEKYDSQEPKLGLKLAEMADAVISVDSNETENLLADIPSARRAARSAATRPVGDIFERRNVRSVNLGNALYPTEWLARRHGMSQEELAKAFWAGVNVSAADVQAKGEALRKALEAARNCTSPTQSGTDLTSNRSPPHLLQRRLHQR